MFCLDEAIFYRAVSEEIKAQRAASGNLEVSSTGGFSGKIEARVGEFDPEVLERYKKAGGKI
jgi:hypothetical protein